MSNISGSDENVDLLEMISNLQNTINNISGAFTQVQSNISNLQAYDTGATVKFNANDVVDLNQQENIENLEVKNGMEFITDKNSDLKKLTERTMKKFLNASNGNGKEKNLEKYRNVTKTLMNAFVKDKSDLNTIKQMLQKNMNLNGEQSNKLFNGMFDTI